MILIEQNFKREVRIISVDFSDGRKIYPLIAEQLQDLDIGILGKPLRTGYYVGILYSGKFFEGSNFHGLVTRKVFVV